MRQCPYSSPARCRSGADQSHVCQNRRHYVQEALGLTIFMLAACFFGLNCFSSRGFLFSLMPDPLVRQLVMGLMMG